MSKLVYINCKIFKGMFSNEVVIEVEIENFYYCGFMPSHIDYLQPKYLDMLNKMSTDNHNTINNILTPHAYGTKINGVIRVQTMINKKGKNLIRFPDGTTMFISETALSQILVKEKL